MKPMTDAFTPTSKPARPLGKRLREHTLRLLLCLLLGATASAHAQDSADHDISIRIPNYTGLKIVDENGDITNAASVTFDYSADPTGFLSAALNTGLLMPTATAGFADIQIFTTSRRGWRVQVRALDLTYSGARSGAGLALSDLEVKRGEVSGLSVGAGSVDADWRLATGWNTIATGNQSTNGWKSLGFNGDDYRVHVQGDEDSGKYVTRVTYRLLNP